MKHLWLVALALAGSVSAWSASCPVEVSSGKVYKAESGTGYRVFVTLKNVSSVAVKLVEFDAVYVDKDGKHFEPASYFSDENIKPGASDHLEWEDVQFEEKVFAAKTPERTEFRLTKIDLADNTTVVGASECIFKF